MRRRTQAPKLGDFEPIRKLGDGGYAEVVLVKEKTTKHLFAMKVRCFLVCTIGLEDFFVLCFRLYIVHSKSD